MRYGVRYGTADEMEELEAETYTAREGALEAEQAWVERGFFARGVALIDLGVLDDVRAGLQIALGNQERHILTAASQDREAINTDIRWLRLLLRELEA